MKIEVEPINEPAYKVVLQLDAKEAHSLIVLMAREITVPEQIYEYPTEDSREDRRRLSKLMSDIHTALCKVVQ